MKSPHLDPAWLCQKYEVEGLSTYEIAAIVGRNPKCIHDKLKDFGIPTRPRGSNLRGKDNAWAKPGYVSPWTGRKHTAASKEKISKLASRPRPHLRGAQNGMYGMAGELNPNYKDGTSPERQRVYASSEWKEVERKVSDRDGSCCRRCGNGYEGPKSLHIHHIIAWSDDESLRMSEDNLVTLCRPCHEWVHSKANTRREFLAHRSPSLSSSDST